MVVTFNTPSAPVIGAVILHICRGIALWKAKFGLSDTARELIPVKIRFSKIAVAVMLK